MIGRIYIERLALCERKQDPISSQTQTMPPLARSTCPLIQEPSGPARKETAAAISCGVPRRSRGFIFAMWLMSSCDLQRRNRSVAVGPGAIALTVTDRPRSSLERIAVRVSTADLVAA